MLEYTSPAFRRLAQRRRGQHGRGYPYGGEQGGGREGEEGRWLSQFGLVKKAVVRISIGDDKWKDVWDLGQCREGSCACREHHGQHVGPGKRTESWSGFVRWSHDWQGRDILR